MNKNTMFLGQLLHLSGTKKLPKFGDLLEIIKAAIQKGAPPYGPDGYQCVFSLPLDGIVRAVDDLSDDLDELNRIARPFGMRLTYCTVHQLMEFQFNSKGVELLELEDAARQAGTARFH